MKMVEAARQALQSLGRPASTREIYDEIMNRNLYTFGAKSPVSVLSGTMRQATDGSPRLKGKPLFRSPKPGTFELVE